MLPLIGPIIFAGILTVNLFQFSALRKNMRAQTEQQILANILQVRTRLEDSELFTNMAKDSEHFQKRFSLVNKPSEYYTVVSFLDLLEYLFRLNQAKLIDPMVWSRWKRFAELVMTIPQFKRLWPVTKTSHTKEFAEFIDGLIDHQNTKDIAT